MFAKRKARANFVYSVRDLCGLLPLLQSLDDARIVAEVSREVVGADPGVEVKSWFEDPMIATVRRCLEKNLHSVLEDGERELRIQGKLDISNTSWTVYMLSACFDWRTYVTRNGSVRTVSCGPSRFFQERDQEVLWVDAVGGSLAAWWYYPPPLFHRVCSELGRLIVLMTRTRLLFESSVQARWCFKVYGSSSARICILVDPQSPDPDGVSKAWTEACLLQEGM
jgi:hypothetical protein